MLERKIRVLIFHSNIFLFQVISDINRSDLI